jgi:hypothetical protein
LSHPRRRLQRDRDHDHRSSRALRPRLVAPRIIPHVGGDGRDPQRQSFDVLKAKELGERADKRKELHADADLGETVGVLRKYFEPERRDSTLYLIEWRVALVSLAIFLFPISLKSRAFRLDVE